MKKISIASLCGVLLLAITALPAMAVPYSFSRITDNAPGDIAAQLSLDVTDSGGGQVSFAVINDGSVDAGARIHEVYWDFSPSDLLTNMVIPAGWFTPAKPANLPGGNEMDPKFTADQAADNGVGDLPPVVATFLFDGIFGAVIDALDGGSLRVGLHVGSIYGDFSDGFVTGGPPENPVPEPSTIVLLGSGLLGLAYFRRRKN